MDEDIVVGTVEEEVDATDPSQGPTDPMSASSASFHCKDQLRHEPITKVAEDIQKKTQDHQARIRDGMKKKYNGNQNVVVFAKGDFATLAVIGSNRASLDQRRIFVKIKDVPKDHCYELQCEFGTLQRKVTATSLNTVPEAIVVTRVAVSCNCRKGCGTRRCPCYKNDGKCTQYCHHMEYDCGNMAERIIDRTEKPIIELDLSDDTDKTVVPTKPGRKRTATVSSPKQRRYKQPKKSAPPPVSGNIHSAYHSLGGRPSRRRKPTSKAREQAQWDDAEAHADADIEEVGGS